ncbi:hypothetical protein [Streptomyces sp. NBC_00728]|uniref:hypothetical protein n=1 Tax=Streptomyces sp. NBC_00728 TaxID=2903676 RepID=UPI0038680D8D
MTAGLSPVSPACYEAGRPGGVLAHLVRRDGECGTGGLGCDLDVAGPFSRKVRPQERGVSVAM